MRCPDFLSGVQELKQTGGFTALKLDEHQIKSELQFSRNDATSHKTLLSDGVYLRKSV